MEKSCAKEERRGLDRADIVRDVRLGDKPGPENPSDRFAIGL
jgi:hypothetical protein